MGAIEEIWDFVDAAVILPDCDVRARQLDIAIDHILSLIQADDGNASFWYLHGFACYMHPDRMLSVMRQASTEASFRRAIEIHPEHSNAYLYLAYHFYDLNHFKKAASTLASGTSINLDRYYVLKWNELYLCCQIQNQGIQSCLEDMERFLTEARQHPSIDICPFVLFDCVAQNVGGAPLAAVLRVQETMKTLEALGEFTKRNPVGQLNQVGTVVDQILSQLRERNWTGTEDAD